MEKILIVSQNEKSIKTLTALLNADGYNNVKAVTFGAEARRAMIGNSFEIIIINMPLEDETGMELAFQAADTDASVLAIVGAGNENLFGRFGIEKGIFVLTKPLNRRSFQNAVRYISSAQRRLLVLRDENAALLKKIEEIKVINRAKCLLISVEKMDENEAHHFIEKEAMALGLTKHQTAERILKKY
ncbi:MAG: ANTAR domain-containing protein [Clostridiales bacterium]